MKHTTGKVSAALALVLMACPAYAMDNEAVMKQLKAMQAQIDSLQRELKEVNTELSQTRAKQRAADKAVSEGKAGTGRVTSDTDLKITMSPAPKIETADGSYSFKVGGFAQVDAGVFHDDRRDHPDGTNIRRARLNASGVIAKDFKYKIENDFAGNSSVLTDVYLEYVGLEPFSIMVGQFKEPFNLENLTSDLFTTFNERSLPVVFAPDRNIGVMLSANGKSGIGSWTAALGGFGAGSGTASTDDESRDVTGRLTLAPIAEKDQVIHLGIAGSHRIPDSATDSMRFSSRPENRLTSSFAVDTGSISAVDNVDLLGLEAAGVYGPVSVQGEYIRAEVDRKTGLDPEFDSFYAEISYFLTGESRNYAANQGKFDRVKPKDPFSFSQGGWGAWQLAARYSELDLTDGTVVGGEIADTSFSVKWIPVGNVSMSANYIMTNTDGRSTTPFDDPNHFIFRTQFDF